MLERLLRFTLRMYPPFPAQTAIFASFAVNFWALSRFFFYRPVPLVELLAGGLTSIAFTLLLRVYDEVKDHLSDPLNFPDRPLVKKEVSVGDLKAFMWILNGVVVAVNLPFVWLGAPWVVGAAAALLGFGFLMYRWFFAERLIRPSLPLAFVTHHPVVAFQQFYILSFFIPRGIWAGRPIPMGAVVFLVGTGLCFTQWEIGRKIRGKSEETAYVTYSRLFWPVAPTVAVLVLGLVTLGLTFAALGFAISNPWLLVPWLIPAALWALLAQKCLAFARSPKKAPPIRQGVENFTLGLLGATVLVIALSIWF